MSKPTELEIHVAGLKREIADRADCERSLTEWNERLTQEIAALKVTNAELLAVLEWSGRDDGYDGPEQLRRLADRLIDIGHMTGWVIWLRRKAKLEEDAIKAAKGL